METVGDLKKSRSSFSRRGVVIRRATTSIMPTEITESAALSYDLNRARFVGPKTEKNWKHITASYYCRL